MPRPTRRLVLCALAGFPLAALPAVFLPRLWPVWAVALAAGAAAAAVDAVRLPGRRRIRVAVSAPSDLVVGEHGVATVSLHLPAPPGSSAEMAADLSAELSAQPQAAVPLDGGDATVPLVLEPRRRGTVAIERIWVRVTGPFGLMRAVSVFPVERSIRVIARAGGSRGPGLRMAERLDARAGRKVERFDGDGSEFDALREFRPGDDRRTIDWKSSARHRLLLRRQFRAERDHEVVLAVDTGRLMAARLQGVPKIDHAVEAALRLAHVALRTGDRVGLFGFDERPRVRAVPRGGLRVHALLARAAAGLDAREVETNFTLGLTSLLQTLRRRSLVVVLTDFSDTVTAELMVENLRRARRRHVVVLVAISDPALEAIEGAAPVDRASLHRAVIAGTLRRERALVLQRLRRFGVHPIDAPPNRVGAEMISRYLDLKRREIA